MLSTRLTLPFRAVSLPLPLARRIGAHETRRHAVHGDAERSQLMGELPGQPDLASLRRRIGLDAGEAHADAGTTGDVDDAAPSRAPFMAGMTACAIRNAPVRFTARIACHSGSVTVSAGLPDLPADAARAVHQHVRTCPKSPTTRLHGRGVGDIQRGGRQPILTRPRSLRGPTVLISTPTNTVAPRRAKRLGDSPPDAVTGAGDEDAASPRAQSKRGPEISEVRDHPADGPRPRSHGSSR